MDTLSQPALLGSREQGQGQGKACIMGPVCCSGRPALFSSPNRALLLGYRAQVLLTQVCTH